MLLNDQEDPFFFFHAFRDSRPVRESIGSSYDSSQTARNIGADRISGETSEGSLSRIATAIEVLTTCAQGIVDSLSSATPSTVDTVYVAERLGCSTVWIAEQARSGAIPSSCVVPGTGNGRPWKFHRAKIDAWIRSR